MNAVKERAFMDDFAIVPENDPNGDWLFATASLCLSGIATGLAMTGSLSVLG